IRIIDRCSPSIAAATNRIAVADCCPRASGEILVAEERGCRPHRIDASEAIVRCEFGITAGEKRSHAQMVRAVVRDASREEIAAREAVRRAGLYVEGSDAPFPGVSEDFHAGIDRDDAPLDQADC